MKVTQDGTEARQTTLRIELAPEEVEVFMNRAYKKVVHKITIPGFRKGKAPRRIVEQFAGREYLLSEALDEMIPEVTRDAVAQENLEVADVPQVEVLEHDPVVLKATVPLVPFVDLGDYRSTLRLEPDPVEVTDEEVQEVLEKLRGESTPWTPVERGAQYGDLVTLNFHAGVGEEMIGDQHDVQYIPEEGSISPVPGFAEQLVGLASGADKEFDLDMPEDHPDPSLSGKTVHFQVWVTEIKAKELPDLDDEFAKGAGEGYESLDALKAKVRADLQERAERTAKSQYHDKLAAALVESVTVEVAPITIEHEIDHMLEDYQRRIQQGGMKMDDYLGAIGKTEDDLREELRDGAVSRLKRSAVLEKVAEAEGIAVSPELMDEELENLTKGSDQPEALRGVFAGDRGRQALERLVWNRLVMERLESIAQEDTPAAAEGETESAEVESSGSQQS